MIFVNIIIVAIIFTVLLDVFVTIFSQAGAGPITSFWTEKCWKLILFFRYRRNNEYIIDWSGPVFLVGIIAVWYLILYLCWVLLFYLNSYSIKSEEGVETQITDIIYYIGSTFTSLGMGDLTPAGLPWTFLTTNGTLIISLLISLSISYIIPVLSAVVSRRKLISLTRSLGKSSEQILDRCWTGKDSGKLDSTVLDIGTTLVEEAYKSHVYPVLEYFYFKESGSSLNLSVLNLHDALILQLKNKERVGNISLSRLNFLLECVDNYVHSMRKNFRYGGSAFKYDHSDFYTFTNVTPHDEPLFENLKAKSPEELRECLLVLAYREGRCAPTTDGYLLFPPQYSQPAS